MPQISRSRSFTRRALLGGALETLARRPASAREQRFNVLFVIADDLRTELGCYGRPWVKTPNIDRLAGEGATFTRHYCQMSLCSPSRTSVLTGLRPNSTGIFDLRTHFRKNLPDVVTLPEQFARHGYATTGFSKIYHLGNHTPGGLDDTRSWTEPSWHPGGPKWGTRDCRLQAEAHQVELVRNGWTCDINMAGVSPEKPGGRTWEVPSWEALDVADNELTDGQTTDAAIEGLEALRDRPFFLAAGFLNPHLPFVAPKRYFDMYPLSQIELPRLRRPPEGAPSLATHTFGELRQYNDIPFRGALDDRKTRELIRGYYAATTFMDAQVGRLTAALRRLGLWDNTIVVLWGDNGFHLGEHGMWSKHTNFEETTRVPLIVRVPGHKGARIAAVTESLDIYPSLCDLCGVSKPEGLEGRSLAPLMRDPSIPWKQAAFSQFPRRVPDVGEAMGYSVRTERYRLTEWTVRGKDYLQREFYDYSASGIEEVNVASRPENAAVVRQLSGMLDEVRKRRA
jgi:arylsulfatase A-like enzyme